MAQAGEIGPQQLESWGAAGREYVLLDVREPEEIAMASVHGAIEIPMREVQRRVNEIPRGKAVVVMCHLGQRSEYIARFLAAGGFEEVYNLEGGIDAYSTDVDRSIPRY